MKRALRFLLKASAQSFRSSVPAPDVNGTSAMRLQGWIPTVSGYLSFKSARNANIPGRCTYLQFLNSLTPGANGEIWSLQKRNLSDRPFDIDTPGIGRLRVFGGSRKISCLFAGTHDQGGADGTPVNKLSGVVVFVPRMYQNILESLWENLAPKDDTAARRSLLDLQQLVQKFVDGQIRDVNLPRSLFLVAQLEVERNGTAEVRVDEKRLAEHEDAVLRRFAFEVFSFAKDLLHTHKFHSVHDDAIVVAYDVDEPENGAGNWQLRTAKNLHRSVVSTLQTASEAHVLLDALGRLAYLDSFLTSHASALRAGSFNTGQLRTVIQTKLDLAAQTIAYQSSRRQLAPTLMFAMAAVLVALFQLLQLPCIDGLSYVKPDAGAASSCAQVFKVDKGLISKVGLLLTHLGDVWLFSVVAAGLLWIYGGSFSLRRWHHAQLGRCTWTGWILRVLLGATITSGRLAALAWVGALLCGVVGLMIYLIRPLFAAI